MARCCTSECESKKSFCDVESTTNSDDEPLDNSTSATLKPSYFHSTTTDENRVTTSIEDIPVASPLTTSISDDGTNPEPECEFKETILTQNKPIGSSSNPSSDDASNFELQHELHNLLTLWW